MSKRQTATGRCQANLPPPSATFAQIITALDIGIERLENDFYDTQAEAWTDYGAQYAHERLFWAFRELEKKTAKKKGGSK